MEIFNPPFMIVRENQVSPTFLKRMSVEKLSEYVELLNSLDQQINKANDELILVLEKEIGKMIEENNFPKTLINVKRKIFNNKKISIEEDALLCNTSTFKTLWNTIKKIKLEYKELYLKYEKRLEIELYNSRKILIESYENPYLRNACKFINIGIIDFLEKYKNLNLSELKSRDRKKEVGWLKIFLKATSKTSPFSTFTNTKIISDDLTIFKKDCLGNRNIAAINVTVILKMYSKIKEMDEYRLNMPYMLNPSLDKIDNYYAYSILDDGDQNKIFQSESRLCQIKENPLLNYLCDNLGEKEITFSHLITSIPRLKETVYFKLIDAMILIPTVKIAMKKEHICFELAKILEEFNLIQFEKINSIYELLLSVNKLVDEYNVISLENNPVREKKYINIGKQINNINRILEIDEIDLRDIVYEDFVSAELVEEIPLNLEDDLTEIIKISNLFDENMRLQNYLGEVFHSIYENALVDTSDKRMINLIVNNNRKYNYLWDNEWDIESIMDDSKLNIELDNLKSEFIELVESHSELGDISIDEVKKITKKIPNAVTARTNSYDIFLQKNNSGEYILNDIYKGFLTYFTRFLDYMVDPVAPAFIEYKNNAFIKGNNIIAEIMEFQGFNSNIHQAVAPLRFITKGSYERTNDYGASNGLLNFSELKYIYDNDEKRIKLTDPLGNYHSVIFLGNLMPMSLPGIFGLLNPLFSSFKMDYLPHKYFFNLNVGKEVIEIPQIKIGNIVIQRKGWIVKRTIIEKRFDLNWKKQAYNLISLFKKLKIPEQVFIQGYFGQEFSMEETDMDMGKMKPIYIDLSNSLILFHIRKLIAETEYIYIEECNPYFSDDNVKEYLVEVTNKGE